MISRTHYVMTAPAAQRQADDVGKLLLRLTLGCLLLLHGISKVKSGPDMMIQIVTQHGLPAALAYGVYLGEVVAPVFVIAGWWTRTAALVITVNMLFAIGLVHMGQLGTLSKEGGWALELQAFYLVSAIAVVLLGPGLFSLGERRASSAMPRWAGKPWPTELRHQ